jgi:hypothetical protein
MDYVLNPTLKNICGEKGEPNEKILHRKLNINW